MSGYQDLKVYEKSYEAAKGVYELTGRFPKEEQYMLTSQIRRAAISVPVNIAEGYGKREGDKELSRYLRIAKGSCAEMEVLLDFARDFGYIEAEAHAKERSAYEEIARMLNGLIKSIQEE